MFELEIRSLVKFSLNLLEVFLTHYAMSFDFFIDQKIHAIGKSTAFPTVKPQSQRAMSGNDRPNEKRPHSAGDFRWAGCRQ